MGATKNFLPALSNKRLAVATAVAMLGFGCTVPAFADTTEDLLKSLRAKGVISQEEYDRLIQQERTESKNNALEQSNAASSANDSVKKLSDAFANTKISGKAYVDFTKESASFNPKNGSPNTKGNTNGIGTDVKRFYVDINHKFDDNWSADITTDMHIGREPAGDTYGGDGGTGQRTGIFVKKAYVQYKASDALMVRAGSADMPWILYVEGLYGYRYVDNTITDRFKVANSADWGLHFGGKLFGGIVGYALSGVNGNGYSTEQRQRSVDFEGRVNVVPVSGLDLAAGFYSGKLGTNTQANANITNEHFQNAKRVDLLASYVMPNVFRVGAEYFSAKNWKNTNAVITPPTSFATPKASGYSLWGSVNITDPIAIFARFDAIKPYKDDISAGTNLAATTTATDVKVRYFNVGVSYAVIKGVDLALVYKRETDTGANTVNNLTAAYIPGLTVGNPANSNNGKTTINEFGLFSQIAW